MSCIAAVIDEKGVIHVAADTLAGIDDEVHIRKDRKLFRNNKYIIGFCGSIRAGQLLRPEFWDPPEDINLLGESIRILLKEAGCLSEGQPETCETNFLFLSKESIIKVFADFQVAEPAEDFTTIGSGRMYAFGSLYETQFLGMSGKDRVIRAIECAKYFHPLVGGDIIYDKIE